MKKDEVNRIGVVAILLLMFGCDQKGNTERMATDRQKQTELLQMLDAQSNEPYWRYNEMGLIDMMVLSGDAVTHDNIRIVATMESLKELVLACCMHNNEPLSADDFKQLKSLKNLKRLELYGAMEVLSKEMWQTITDLSQLEELVISYVKVPTVADDFNMLKRLKNLNRLALRGTVDVLPEEMCQIISELSQLRELEIGDDISPDGIAILEKMIVESLILPKE